MSPRSRSRDRRQAELNERYGPWALITGASSGIGAEFARQIADAGVNTALIARRVPKLEALAGELEVEHGIETRVVALDLTEPDFGAVLGRAIEDLDIGLLVNNAGTTVGGAFLETDPALHRREVELNVLAPLLLTHDVARRMLSGRRGGGIILVSSMFALQGVPNFANYAATKSYELALADGLTGEFGALGLDVLSVLPGPTLTEGTRRLGAEQSSGPMAFGPPEAVAARALVSLGRRRSVVPGRMNRVMASVSTRAMSRSSRTRMWGSVLGRMGMTGAVVSSAQRLHPGAVDSAALPSDGGT